MGTVKSLKLEYGDALFQIFGIHIAFDRGVESPRSHVHGYYELHYARSGSHEYVFENSTVKLTAGNMLIIPPGVRHRIVEKDNPNFDFVVLSFSLTRGEKQVGFYNAFRDMLEGPCLTAVQMSSGLYDNIQAIKNLIDQDDILSFCTLKKEGAAFIERLVAGLKKYLPDTFTPSHERTRNDVLALLDIMVSRCEFSLSDIAEQINYSPRHTARLIKRIYGASLSSVRRAKNVEMPEKTDNKNELCEDETRS